MKECRLDIKMPRFSKSWHEIKIDDSVEDKNCPYGLVPVGMYSNRYQRKAVYKFAKYFQKEFQYDFVQYGYQGEEDDSTAIAYLWVTDSDLYLGVIVYGACCFRWREWNNHHPSWALQWIWLHPFRRNQGELSRVWSYFKEKFGNFHVEPPLSKAMQNFLAKETQS